MRPRASFLHMNDGDLCESRLGRQRRGILPSGPLKFTKCQRGHGVRATAFRMHTLVMITAHFSVSTAISDGLLCSTLSTKAFMHSTDRP